MLPGKIQILLRYNHECKYMHKCNSRLWVSGAPRNYRNWVTRAESYRDSHTLRQIGSFLAEMEAYSERINRIITLLKLQLWPTMRALQAAD